jgi:hypothetical protein
MASKSRVVCLTCDTTLILPDDPVRLAHAMTDFIETHNRMQHWKFDLIPGEDANQGVARAAKGES